MKINYKPVGINNFHNSAPLKLYINSESTISDCGWVLPITKYQAVKIRKHFCGISGCGCPQGAVIETGENQFGIRVEYARMA